LITKLETLYSVTLQFKHIPRTQNCLCDGMCQMITNAVQKEAIHTAQQIVSTVTKDLTIMVQQLPQSKSKRWKYSQTTSSPLDSISLNKVPLYSRLPLLCEVASVAMQVQNGIAMRWCAKAFLKEAQELQTQFPQKWNELIGYPLEHNGWTLEYIALIQMNLQKEAKKVYKQGSKRRKTTFFVKNNYNRNDETPLHLRKKDLDDATSTDAILEQLATKLTNVQSTFQSECTEIINKETLPQQNDTSLLKNTVFVNDWCQFFQSILLQEYNETDIDHGYVRLVTEENMVCLLKQSSL